MTKEEEYKRVVDALRRPPTETELGIINALWSEHCSYKSSKKWLGLLPNEGAYVVQGPGENAGVIDIGQGLGVAFKIESHNHPSMIEPFQGAATGVGGILRDIFTMGARPIASLNALRFGSLDHPRMSYFLTQVVEGIGWYGNCVGVPTVGGEVGFDSAYNENILVNAMTVGLVRLDKLVGSRARGVGNAVVYLGAQTGPEGIQGATMASTSLNADLQTHRPQVQIGDPFTEKRLLEAYLEMVERDLVLAAQDMGAAGLSSSTVEMAAKGGIGLSLDLDQVPTRGATMTAYDIMLSETQERLVLIVEPTNFEKVQAIGEKWDLCVVRIGSLIESQRILASKDGRCEADLPLELFTSGMPSYDREWIQPSTPSGSHRRRDSDQGLDRIEEDLSKILGSSHGCSRKWIWEQYDSQVGADTIFGPGQADAAVVRIYGSNQALAMTTDCVPRYCVADPLNGGKQAVIEAWRNLTAVGALPLAMTNNLNFGNPENPHTMGYFVAVIQGMSEACRFLEFPAVSGNVSLYNEGATQSIPPTPVIGGVGLLEDWSLAMDLSLKGSQEILLLIGDTAGHLDQSLYFRLIKGDAAGPMPPLDLDREKRYGNFIRELIRKKLISACHDISDGGAILTLLEMAFPRERGLILEYDPKPLSWTEFLWGEDQGRYIAASPRRNLKTIEGLAHKADIPLIRLGVCDGSDLVIGDRTIAPIVDLKRRHQDSELKRALIE